MTGAAHSTPPKGKLRSLGLAGQLMRDHYLELDEASTSGSRKIAWCSSVGPAELLRALGFLVYFPENHTAMLGASRRSTELMRAATRIGYSPDICSYLRSDIGAFLSGETALGGVSPTITAVPRPDVLVFNTNQCRDVKDWFSWYAKALNVPCIGVEGHCNVDEVTTFHVQAISAQLQAMVPRLEAIAETTLELDRLSRTVALSRACSERFGAVLELAAHVPSPISFFNGLLLMGPAVVARGTESAVRFYDTVIAELDHWIAAGKGAVKKETHRLYWEGMPVWGKVGPLSRLFSSLETCVVASTFCHSWVFDALMPEDPFDSMARAYTELFIVRSDAAKEAYLERAIERFKVDGIIFNDTKTCPNNSNNRYGLPNRLSRRLGIPCTTIYSDHNDLSLYDDSRVTMQIEAFVEQLDRR